MLHNLFTFIPVTVNIADTWILAVCINRSFPLVKGIAFWFDHAQLTGWEARWVSYRRGPKCLSCSEWILILSPHHVPTTLHHIIFTPFYLFLYLCGQRSLGRNEGIQVLILSLRNFADLLREWMLLFNNLRNIFILETSLLRKWWKTDSHLSSLGETRRLPYILEADNWSKVYSVSQFENACAVQNFLNGLMDTTVSSQNSFYFTLIVSEFSAFSKGYYSEKKIHSKWP